MQNQDQNQDQNHSPIHSIGARSPAGTSIPSASKLALAALSALILTGTITSSAQAKGRHDTYVCVSSYTVIVCKKHDSLGRCTKLGNKKICNGWKKVVVSSRVTQPGKVVAK